MFRARAVEDTLALLRSRTQVLGISRVANITGLDRVGIPVFQTVRPNALHISVSQGKGLCDASAETSALMEALEIVHAERVRPSLRAKPSDILGDARMDALDPARCERGIRRPSCELRVA